MKGKTSPHENQWSETSFAGLIIIVVALLINGCRQAKLEPVELAPGDMCTYCKMAISEKRFATQFIDHEGQAFKFDDMGCMIDFIRGKQNKEQIAAYFVMDFETRQWINVEDAYYVSSTELKSPMGGDTAAFKEEAKAQEAVSKFQGKLLRFNDILK